MICSKAIIEQLYKVQAQNNAMQASAFHRTNGTNHRTFLYQKS